MSIGCWLNQIRSSRSDKCYTLIERLQKNNRLLINRYFDHHHHRTYSFNPNRTNNALDDCLQILRTNDHASVLQIPFWPSASRSAFVAIRAFNAELSLIPDSITSGKTLIGQMRYQWWRDAIQSCYADHEQTEKISSNHPVISVLRWAITEHKLSKYYFTRMIDAREQHYLNSQFHTIDSMVSYSQATVFSLLSLLQQSLKLNHSHDYSKTDHALSHLANFISISTLLQSLPFYYQTQQISIIPSEIMKCSEEELIRFSMGKNQDDRDLMEKIQHTIIDLVVLAWSEMTACRDVINGNPHDFEEYRTLERQTRLERVTVDRSIMPVFLCSTPSRTYLNRLESNHFNVFVPKLKTRDWKLPFKIWYDQKFRKV